MDISATCEQLCLPCSPVPCPLSGVTSTASLRRFCGLVAQVTTVGSVPLCTKILYKLNNVSHTRHVLRFVTSLPVLYKRQMESINLCNLATIQK